MIRNKSKISFLIFIIFGLLSLLIGSYALITYQVNGTKRQVITSGSLYLELKEENEIIIGNAYPTADEVGMLYNPYNFTLTNKGNVGLKYALKLVDITNAEEKLFL